MSNNEIKIKRVKEIMELEGFRSNRKFCEKIGYKASNFSNAMNGRDRVGNSLIDKIVSAFPEKGYRAAYLRGEDDYLTNADMNMAALNIGSKEADILEYAFFGLAKLNGFVIENNLPCPQDREAENAIKNLYAGYTVKRDGKNVSLSWTDLNALENKLCDYLEFELLHMMN